MREKSGGLNPTVTLDRCCVTDLSPEGYVPGERQNVCYNGRATIWVLESRPRLFGKSLTN